MRALAVVAVAGCFSPRLPAHLRCETPDNWCPPPQTCGQDGFCNGGTIGMMPDAGGLPEGNLMFVSSDTLTFTTTTTTAMAQAAADLKCQQLGQHLRAGTYIAWMGDTNAAAANRVPVDTGWARPDRLPVATSLADLVNDHLYYPPRIDDLMADAVAVNLQTRVAAELDGGCTATGNLMNWGVPDGALASWHHSDVNACEFDFWVYCLETDRTTKITAPVLDPNNLYAFVTSQTYAVSTGLVQLDADCMKEANGVVPGTFQAFAATSTASARSRFVPSTKAWTRGDGVVIALPTLSMFFAPLDTDVHGVQFAAHAADGATNATSMANQADNCSDWMSSSATANVALGDDSRSDGQAIFGAMSGTCDQPQHLYCLQIP